MKEAFDKTQRVKENKRKNSQEMPSMEELRRGEINVAEVKQRLLKRYSKEEILCDAMGQMNAFATEEMERVAGEVGVFLRNVRKAAKDTEATKNTTREGGVYRIDNLGSWISNQAKKVI